MERFNRERSRCGECPLDGSIKVQGYGGTGGIVFVGEAPSTEEERQKKPFVGPAGTELYKACKSIGVELYQHYVMNTTLCKFPQNDFDGMDAEEARKFCQKGFEDELKMLKAQGVKVIASLGQNITSYLGIPGAISKVRGSVYESRGFFVVPTYHPAFFARHQGSWHKEDGSVTSMRLAWMNDLNKIKRIGSKGWQPPKENFILHPTLRDIEEFVERVISNQALVAVDIETTGINPAFGEIVVVGLADSAESGIVVPFLQRGGKSYWNFIEEEMKARNLLNKVFCGCPLIFQNAFFDVKFLQAKDFVIGYENVQHDSLILHHVVSPEQPHNLGFIVSIYGDTPYWKEDLKGREGTILEMKDETLRTYNLRDCVVLHQVLPGLLEDIDRLGSRQVYEEEAIPLMAPVGAMMERGIYFDHKKLAVLKAKYVTRTAELEVELRQLWKLPEAFNFSAPGDMRWLYFGERPSKFSKLKELEKYEGEKPLKAGTKKHQGLLALRELETGVVGFTLPVGFRPRKTAAGKQASVEEQVIQGLILSMNNRVGAIEGFKTSKPVHQEEKAAYERQIHFLERYLAFKEAAKILSTYTDYRVGPDGRVHTQFLMHGTATGRLAGRDPNLMNLPKDLIELRSPFAASPGMVLLSADYNNLEVRVLAAITKDEVLFELFRQGANIHDSNTEILFGFDSSHKDWKSGRAAAKVFQFGGIQYGGGDREVYEKCLLKAPKLGLTFERYVAAKERWMAAHPAYRKWRDAVTMKALTTRKSICWNGRVRMLFGNTNDIIKQALNTPIQGGAAAIINQATIRLHRRLKASRLKAYLILQVHDQLIWEVAPEDLRALAIIVKEEMERPIPELGVDFPVEMETGPNLGELENYKDEI